MVRRGQRLQDEGITGREYQGLFGASLIPMPRNLLSFWGSVTSSMNFFRYPAVF